MTTKRLVRISYFTLLTVVGGLIKIPAGPVSFTLQTLFVILAGFVLGATACFLRLRICLSDLSDCLFLPAEAALAMYFSRRSVISSVFASGLSRPG